MLVRYALRDERVNVFGMTHGGSGFVKSKQIILCKKTNFIRTSLLEDATPFLLDVKNSSPRYRFSEFGKTYAEDCKEKKFLTEYIAIINSTIRVRLDIELIQKLYEKKFFPLWAPGEPLNYFEGASVGYLVVFRVYESDKIDERLLGKGRKGRNFYYTLSEPIDVNLHKPVLNETQFDDLKFNLIDTLSDGQWVLDVDNYQSHTETIETQKDIDLITAETFISKTTKHLSLDELKKRIEIKGTQAKTMNVVSKQYYRDPYVSAYAKRRANGICECCGFSAPFLTNADEPYLETHHLKPLAEGGEDTIENTFAVCPNCHRSLHLAKDNEKYKKRLLGIK